MPPYSDATAPPNRERRWCGSALAPSRSPSTRRGWRPGCACRRRRAPGRREAGAGTSGRPPPPAPRGRPTGLPGGGWTSRPARDAPSPGSATRRRPPVPPGTARANCTAARQPFMLTSSASTCTVSVQATVCLFPCARRRHRVPPTARGTRRIACLIVPASSSAARKGPDRRTQQSHFIWECR